MEFAYQELVRQEAVALLATRQQQQLEYQWFQRMVANQQPLVPQQPQPPQQIQQAGGQEQIKVAPQMAFNNQNDEQNLMNMFSHIVGQQQQEHKFSAFFTLIGRPEPNMPPPQ